jgi:hypothetical protein
MMNKIKNIRQGLVKIRNILNKGGNLTDDQYKILETLTSHEHYSIRRQASGLMVKISNDYRNQMFSGALDSIAVESP